MSTPDTAEAEVIVLRPSAGVASVQGALALDLTPRTAPPRPRLRSTRASDLAELERASREQVDAFVGRYLQAAVEIRCAGDKFAALSSLGDDLKFIFICSSTVVVEDETEAVSATPLDHAKCERCWHVREDVGADAAHPGLCGRCVSNLHGAGEVRTCA